MQKSQLPLLSQAPPPLELLDDELLELLELLLDDELLALPLDDELLELLLDEPASLVVSGIPPLPPAPLVVVPPLWVPLVLPAPPAPVMPGSLKPLAQPDEAPRVSRQSAAGTSKTKVERRMMSPSKEPGGKLSARARPFPHALTKAGSPHLPCGHLPLRQRSEQRRLTDKTLPFCPPAF